MSTGDELVEVGKETGPGQIVDSNRWALLAALREPYADGRASVVDGLRVDWPDRWFHVRVSQTEPVVRIISERRGEAPRELHEAVIEQVRSFA